MTVHTERWNALWSVQRSQRYHARRSAFFDRWSKLTAATGVIGGSAVFASLSEHVPGAIAVAGASMVVVMSSLDLVVGTAQMARSHHDLRRRYCLLEAQMQAKDDATEREVGRWKSERLAIEADEPPTYVALNVLCDNELIRAYPHTFGQASHHLPWYQRWTAHWWRWENA